MFVQRVKCGEELVALLINMEREKYKRGKSEKLFYYHEIKNTTSDKIYLGN